MLSLSCRRFVHRRSALLLPCRRTWWRILDAECSTWLADTNLILLPLPQLFTGMCFMLLDDAGQVTKSVHLEIPEPKTAPLRWTGF